MLATGGCARLPVCLWRTQRRYRSNAAANHSRRSRVAAEFSAMLFAVGVTFLTTILCGLAPAIHAVRGDLHGRLKVTGKGVNANFRHGKFRSGLVVSEVALSIVLLVGAGLMMRSLLALQHVELGLNPVNILVARLPLPKGRYETAAQKKLFFSQVLQRVSALPGVIAVTETSSLPPYGGPESDVVIPGKTHSEHWDTMFQLCSEGYFKTMGRHLLRGRCSRRPTSILLVLSPWSTRLLPAPISERRSDRAKDQVRDARSPAAIYQRSVLRDHRDCRRCEESRASAGDFSGGLPTLHRHGARSADPDQDRRGADVDADECAPRNLVGRPQCCADVDGHAPGLPATVLVCGAAVRADAAGHLRHRRPGFGGDWGLQRDGLPVSLQTHEIGIRMALGSPVGNVLNMVLGKGLRLIGLGIALGVSQAWDSRALSPVSSGESRLTIR